MLFSLMVCNQFIERLLVCGGVAYRSSRLASAKVRRSYLTTKLSSHFFHGTSAGNMHISCTKPSKTADLRPEKIFQLFLAVDCKCEKKIRLLQEKGLKIAPNMFNNIFIALRTLQSPRLLHKAHPARPHHARLHAPCAQAAVEQNVDAVGTFFHGVGTFFHGFYFRRSRGQKKGDAT